MAEESLENTIEQNAAGPAEASGDSGSVKQHGLREQIEADRYLASKRAAKKRRLAIGFVKVNPPGAS